MIFLQQKIAFSADRSLKNGNQIFQSLSHVNVNLKPQFLIKSGYYIAPSPSTALLQSMVIEQQLLTSEYGYKRTALERPRYIFFHVRVH